MTRPGFRPLVGPKADALRAAEAVKRERDELRRLLADINVIVSGLDEAHSQSIDATERLDEKRWEEFDRAEALGQQFGRLMKQRDAALNERDEARRLLDLERAKNRRLFASVLRLQDRLSERGRGTS